MLIAIRRGYGITLAEKNTLDKSLFVKDPINPSFSAIEMN